MRYMVARIDFPCFRSRNAPLLWFDHPNASPQSFRYSAISDDIIITQSGRRAIGVKFKFIIELMSDSHVTMIPGIFGIVF